VYAGYTFMNIMVEEKIIVTIKSIVTIMILLLLFFMAHLTTLLGKGLVDERQIEPLFRAGMGLMT